LAPFGACRPQASTHREVRLHSKPRRVNAQNDGSQLLPPVVIACSNRSVILEQSRSVPWVGVTQSFRELVNECLLAAGLYGAGDYFPHAADCPRGALASPHQVASEHRSRSSYPRSAMKRDLLAVVQFSSKPFHQCHDLLQSRNAHADNGKVYTADAVVLELPFRQRIQGE
jgi:hypothetical protein